VQAQLSELIAKIGDAEKNISELENIRKYWSSELEHMRTLQIAQANAQV